MSQGPAIETENLERQFVVGSRRKRRVVEAVDGISFAVEAGERLAFIGPNGAGKSTSIKMLTGILQPTGGTARVLGLVPWTQRRRLAARIGTLFGQRSQLWVEIPPRASLGVLGAIFGLDAAATDRRIDELAVLFDADGLFDQPARTLSLGQRMRCELAACMLHQPEILFLDEPTIGLDLLAKQRFRELLVRLNAELGTTVFLTSHDVADIEHVANRAVVVNHGTIIYDAAVATMRRHLLAVKQVEVGLARADIDLDLVLAALGPGVTVQRPTDQILRIEVDTMVRPIREVLNVLLGELSDVELPVVDLSVIDPPLERVIGEIYERPA